MILCLSPARSPCDNTFSADFWLHAKTKLQTTLFTMLDSLVLIYQFPSSPGREREVCHSQWESKMQTVQLMQHKALWVLKCNSVRNTHSKLRSAELTNWGHPQMGQASKKIQVTSFKKCGSFYFTVCDGLTLAKCHQHTIPLKKISSCLRGSSHQKGILFYFFQSNLIVCKIYDFNLEIWATIKYYIGIFSTAAKVLFKSILVIINIERQDSATCLAFHHNHLTVAYVFSLYFLQERYGKEET